MGDKLKKKKLLFKKKWEKQIL